MMKNQILYAGIFEVEAILNDGLSVNWIYQVAQQKLNVKLK